MKITIRSDQTPLTVVIEGSDESIDNMVKATKSVLKMSKIWVEDTKAQMSFESKK